jgi:hypothetical protein
VPCHPPDRGRVEQLRTVPEGGDQFRARVDDRQREVEVLRLGIDSHRLDAQALGDVGRARGFLKVEKYLEKRRAAGVSFRRKLLDDLLERHVRVRICLDRPLPNLPEHLLEPRTRLHPRPQHDGVDQQPDHPLQLALVPPRHRRPHDHFFLPRVPPQ